MLRFCCLSLPLSVKCIMGNGAVQWYFANQHEAMAIIPSLEPDADNCKLHNSYDVQSCVLAGVSLVLGTAVCFYGKQEKKHSNLICLGRVFLLAFAETRNNKTKRSQLAKPPRRPKLNRKNLPKRPKRNHQNIEMSLEMSKIVQNVKMWSWLSQPSKVA